MKAIGYLSARHFIYLVRNRAKAWGQDESALWGPIHHRFCGASSARKGERPSQIWRVCELVVLGPPTPAMHRPKGSVTRSAAAVWEQQPAELQEFWSTGF